MTLNQFQLKLDNRCKFTKQDFSLIQSQHFITFVCQRLMDIKMADIPHIDYVKPGVRFQLSYWIYLNDLRKRSTNVYQTGSTIGHRIHWVSGPFHVPCNGFFSTKTQEVQTCADTFSVN